MHKIFAFVGLCAALAIAGWVALLHRMGPPVVCVANEAAVPLGNVILTTSGGHRSLGELDSGDERCCAVEVRGESSLAISFVVAGRSSSEGDLAYLESEGGYCERIRVNGSGNIASPDHRSRCGVLRSLACRLTSGCT